MHATCMSLALLPGSEPGMYGGQHIWVVHTCVTVSGASVYPTDVQACCFRVSEPSPGQDTHAGVA